MYFFEIAVILRSRVKKKWMGEKLLNHRHLSENYSPWSFSAGFYVVQIHTLWESLQKRRKPINTKFKGGSSAWFLSSPLCWVPTTCQGRFPRTKHRACFRLGVTDSHCIKVQRRENTAEDDQGRTEDGEHPVGGRWDAESQGSPFQGDGCTDVKRNPGGRSTRTPRERAPRAQPTWGAGQQARGGRSPGRPRPRRRVAEVQTRA